MSTPETARAVIDALLLAFNPHQRRGPDGRWIKMPTSELQKPRKKSATPAKPDKPEAPPRARAPRAKKPKGSGRAPKPTPASKSSPLPRGSTPHINLPDPEADYRQRRDEYNAEVVSLVEARQQVKKTRDAALDRELRNVQDQKDPVARDAAVDRLRQFVERKYNERDMFEPVPQRRAMPSLPPGPRTEGGPRPPATAPYERRRSALETSLRSGVDGQDVMDQGAMGDTRRFLLADGTQAIYKRAKEPVFDWDQKAQTDAEELAALLGAALGAPVPAVQRVSDDEIYMEVMPGQPGYVRAREEGDLPRERLRADDAKKIGLLDVLIDNADRHGGNWLEDGDDIYAIDHGLAFRSSTAGRSGATLSPFANSNYIGYDGEYRDENPLSDADIDHIRGVLDGVEPEFRRLGRQEWLDTVRARLDQLAMWTTTETGGLYR